MTEETWNKHTPGDPMPCKCGESVVEVRFGRGGGKTAPARRLNWGENKLVLHGDITAWRFVERKGEDVIAADPYTALEWDEDDTDIVALGKPGQPWWVREDDLVRFNRCAMFHRADYGKGAWSVILAFQIKRRPDLTPAQPQLLTVLSVATDDEADAIRSAARRANIEVPE